MPLGTTRWTTIACDWLQLSLLVKFALMGTWTLAAHTSQHIRDFLPKEGTSTNCGPTQTRLSRVEQLTSKVGAVSILSRFVQRLDRSSNQSGFECCGLSQTPGLQVSFPGMKFLLLLDAGDRLLTSANQAVVETEPVVGRISGP